MSSDSYFQPPAFVHVDLDGLWTLAGAYGYSPGRTFVDDPVFRFGIPRLMDLFDELGIRATIFVVARDLELASKRELVQRMVEAGHELGNHSYTHPIGIERLPDAELRREVRHAQSLISELAGFTPVAFRAPGYDCGPRALAALQDAGIRVDGSLLPTRFAPALRWMARRVRAKFTAGAAAARATTPVDDLIDEDAMNSAPVLDPARFAGQYGQGAGGAMDLAPWLARPVATGPAVLRLPLAVSPTLRLPLHASLGMFMGEEAVKTGLRRLAARGWPITYLLHGLDVIAPEEFADLTPPQLQKSSLFTRPLADKLRFVRGVLRELKRIARVEPTSDYLARCREIPAPHAAPQESRSRGRG